VFAGTAARQSPDGRIVTSCRAPTSLALHSTSLYAFGLAHRMGLAARPAASSSRPTPARRARLRGARASSPQGATVGCAARWGGCWA
jgi:hypothetical protein